MGLLLPLLTLSSVKAEQGDTLGKNGSNADTTLPFQMTFITPLGTNGYFSAKSTNYFSLNIIAGYNGGLDGIEIGGFANILRKDMRGTQIAGFSNMVFQDMQGIQVAGFSNVVNHSAQGMMIAGFTNYAAKSSKVVQMAGFSNQVMGAMSGAQIAGFANIATDSVKGAQLAGFGNFSSKNTQAFQASGFINTSMGDMQGSQIAGFANIAGDMEGIQVSGFMNRAKKMNGLQIGIINVADTFESGFPIGFISTVNNGYRNFAFGVNELMWAEAQFRTGVKQFYNIFSLALAPVPDRSGWSFGYGIGSCLLNKPKSELALELVAYHVNEDELWTDALNQVFKLSPRYTYHPTGGRFGIWAAPSINLQVTGQTDYYGETFESDLAPYTVLEDEGYYSTSKLWFGAQVGVSF